MADTTLAAALAATAETVENRKAVLQQTHPLVDQYGATWTTLLDAYEGAGGFMDGAYLWQHAREDGAEFRRRRENARYHNFAKAIVNLYARYVMGKGVTRKTEDAGLTAWWEDVDGAQTTMDAFMGRALKLALAAGHEGILMDKTPETAAGPTKADERARPFVTLYQPTAIRDWRKVRNDLVALKLAEAAPNADIFAPVTTSDEPERYLLWTDTEWARFDADGELLAEGTHDLGRIPFLWLMPESSALHPEIGQSLVGDPNVHKALYNRCSEEDIVLRTQGFSLFVIQANNPDDVERIKAQFGGEVGPTRAIITAGAASFATPDQAVPEAIRANTAWLIQEIYRAAHVRFNRDSLAAESGEAIRLQHAELNEMLSGCAKECQRVEEQLAHLYFAWTSPSPEAAAQAYERSQTSIEYPREFFARELLVEIDEIAQAIALELGQTFETRLKSKLVRRMDPDLDPATLEKVDAELAQTNRPPDPQALQADLQANAQARLAAFIRPAMAEGAPA